MHLQGKYDRVEIRSRNGANQELLLLYVDTIVIPDTEHQKSFFVAEYDWTMMTGIFDRLNILPVIGKSDRYESVLVP